MNGTERGGHEQEEAETSDAILVNAALGLWAARGYEAVGVQEICETANYSKPTLYHFFGSKRGLLEAVTERKMGPLLPALAASENPHDIVYSLDLCAIAWFSFTRSDPLAARLLLALKSSPPESEAAAAFSGFKRALRDFFERLFTEAARDHGNMRGRHADYAASFIGLLCAYTELALSGEREMRDHEARAAVKQFMHGIFS